MIKKMFKNIYEVVINDEFRNFDYRKHLSAKIYWAAQAALFIHVGCLLLLCWKTSSIILFVSFLSHMITALILKPLYEGDKILDSWKLEYFVFSSILIMVQSMLYISPPPSLIKAN